MDAVCVICYSAKENEYRVIIYKLLQYTYKSYKRHKLASLVGKYRGVELLARG